MGDRVKPPHTIEHGKTRTRYALRWFELDCLVERGEFELRCGLEAVLQTLGLDINSSF